MVNASPIEPSTPISIRPHHDVRMPYMCVCALRVAVLLNGSRERWEVSTIVEHLKFDHGYTRSSRAVGFLLEVICEFNDATLATFPANDSPRHATNAHISYAALNQLVTQISWIDEIESGDDAKVSQK